MYNPRQNEQVIVDYALLKERQEKRIGTIINKVQRRQDKGDYVDYYLIRTAYGDLVHARLGQFTSIKRRHLEGLKNG